MILPAINHHIHSSNLLCSRSLSTLSGHRRIPLPTTPFQFQRHQADEENPYDLIREDPIQVCSDLWVRSFSRSHLQPSFTNLTGFLKKFDLWILAYQRSCAHQTGSFPPKNAIHVSELRSLLALSRSVLSGRHPWGAATHLILRSPNDPPSTHRISKRKFLALLESSPPPFQDHVLQELLLLLLEPVFEPRFSPKSHAFRAGRSPHTVIRTIRSNFAGYLWFLKVDLTDIADDFTPEVIVSCLEKAVTDRKVVGLVKSALRTPVKVVSKEDDKVLDKLTKRRMKRKILRKSRKKKVLNENEPKPDPYWLRTFFSFAPEEADWVPIYGHCGILSPLLANICLNELDNWMEDRILNYFQPSKLDSIWKNSIDDGSHNPAWPEFVPSSGPEKTRRMNYVRYGSHILVGIRGPREDAVQLRKDLIQFCEKTYSLQLKNSKTEIEHITRGIQFLDHVISRRVIHPTLRYTATGGHLVSKKGVGTLLSITASLNMCIRKFRKLGLVKGDKDPEPLPCIPMLYSGQAHTNSQMNKLLETMADWYKYADNRKKIVGFCAYVIRSSVAKLYAARYRLKSRAKVYKIASRDLSRPLRESTRNASPEYSDLIRMGLIDAIEGVQFSHMSLIPSCDYTPLPTNWVPDHELVIREYLKLQDPKSFCKLRKFVKCEELGVPQEDVSKIVWNFKVCGVFGRENHVYDKQFVNSAETSTCGREEGIFA
ncbi:uncharacterized protein LOC110029749 [Phalaenopsis equestris]|uniref:uncharacterized protein LOC110029749 n=1 Tax=Phalaenopsis equestris TaxID=78828 RepID=UPI0009E1F343|nr:uncharacterized protein LOC110029749 [Phalaenopsis equestris]